MSLQIETLYQSLFSTTGDVPWKAGRDLKILFISPEINHLTGFTAEEVLASSLDSLFTPETSELIRQLGRPSGIAPTTLPQDGRLFSSTASGSMKCKDGSSVEVEVHASYTTDIQGNPESYQGILRQVKPASPVGFLMGSIAQEDGFYQALLENMGEGIGIVDSEERFIFTNSVANAIFKVLPDSLEGHSLEEFTTPEQFNEVREQTRRRRAGVTSAYLLQIRRADGVLRTLSITATPWRLSNGQPGGTMGIFRDITETIQAEVALRQSEARYRAIVEDQSELIFRFLPSGKITFANDAYCNYFGLSRETVIGTNVMAQIPVDERPRLHAQLFALNQACQAVTYEVRVRLPDGSMRWQQRTDRIIFNESGNLAEFQSVAHDIDERKLAEDHLKAVRAQLAERVLELEAHNHEITLLTRMSNDLVLASHIADACQITANYALDLFPDTSGSILTINADTGLLDQRQNWGKSSTGYKHAASPELCNALNLGRVYLSPQNEPSPLCLYLTHPGPSSAICIPLRTQGHVTGVLRLAKALGESPLSDAQHKLATVVAEQFSLALSNLELRENLRQQAIRDSLTGLYNRYFMESSLEREINRAVRANRPVSLIMLDIDHFKAFNDSWSHPAGDVLLAELGQLLRNSIRSGDIGCRYGGEEFLLILPETPLNVAAERAEQFRQQVERLQIRYEGQILPAVFISLGVACFPNHGTSVKDLLKVVDLALYRAKEEGRNRVAVAE